MSDIVVCESRRAPVVQPATRADAPVVELDLESRLALADAAMNVRLDQAALVFEINTAHLPAPIVDLAEVLPLQPTLTPALTPIAEVLHRALGVLNERGWTRGSLRDEQGAVCIVGAIRAAAGTRGQADDACAIVLDAIQRQFVADTVPSWNDQQSSAGPVLRILGVAADLAKDRGM